MDCHGHNSLTPVGIYEVWPHMRDHAMGTTPLAQYYLNVARQYEAPSKAHKKRLLKDRPKLGVARPARPSSRGEETHRHNDVVALRNVARAVMLRSEFGLPHDPPRKPAPPAPERKLVFIEPLPAKPPVDPLSYEALCDLARVQKRAMEAAHRYTSNVGG